MFMKTSPSLACLLLMITGCSTAVKYDQKLASSPPKPADYPICVYAENTRVPRPFEVIGTMHVSDKPFTVFGGTLDGVVTTLRENARQKGADAVQLTTLKTPEFSTPHYRADANFLRFTDPWDSVAVTEEELRAYFKSQAATLDPIEGIWLVNDPSQSRVGIMQNSSKPRRDFIAFILDTKNLSWHPGDKKLDLARGERPGVYRGRFYLDDYQGVNIAFVFRVPPGNQIVVPTTEGRPPLILTRVENDRGN